MCTAHVFVQGPRTVAWASAPLCVGFPRCGRAVCGRVVCGCGGCTFLFGHGALCGAASLFFRVRRRCWYWAMCFRLRAGVAVRPCAFRWLAPGHRTMLRLERKKKVSYTLYLVSKSVLHTRSPCFSRCRRRSKTSGSRQRSACTWAGPCSSTPRVRSG